MEINLDKTCVFCVGESSEKTQQILDIFPVKSFPLDLGFKYLGYMLKPNFYQISDWHWLINKLEIELPIEATGGLPWWEE